VISRQKRVETVDGLGPSIDHTHRQPVPYGIFGEMVRKADVERHLSLVTDVPQSHRDRLGCGAAGSVAVATAESMSAARAGLPACRSVTSVIVLSVYAKCIDGAEATVNSRIEEAWQGPAWVA
jgi:hypothetical protein